MSWPLMQEHGFLGASLEDGRVVSYLDETPLDEALRGACLFDLTGNLYRFVSGECAQGYIESLCAGPALEPGSCGFSAVLTGDGALVSAPLVVRGGEHEYMVLDASPRRETLLAWMGYIQGIEQNGRRPFEGLSQEEAGDLLVPLMLAGERTPELIADYTGGQPLPGTGSTASIGFDGVPCVLAHPEMEGRDAFVVFAPPSFAVRLFRSFLSFAYVSPLGMTALERFMASKPWWGWLSSDDRIHVGRNELAACHLVRPDADFIGARGLS